MLLAFVIILLDEIVRESSADLIGNLKRVIAHAIKLAA